MFVAWFSVGDARLEIALALAVYFACKLLYPQKGERWVIKRRSR
jgi:hypothetical protein